jgi:mono/diheme cytochrome c family protein
VTPSIDTTSYAQAAALNHDGSHGPLKCGTCHQVDGNGIPSHIQDLAYNGTPILQGGTPEEQFDAAVSWMHTFTENADPRDGYCLNCHQDNRDDISLTNKTWTEHSFKGRSSREMMDKAEALTLPVNNNGVVQVAGDPADGYADPKTTVCTTCHGDRSGTLLRRGCSDKWRNHLIQGRASEQAWVYMSNTYAGSTCGW